MERRPAQESPRQTGSLRVVAPHSSPQPFLPCVVVRRILFLVGDALSPLCEGVGNLAEEKSWREALPGQLLFALLGFLLWWLQDVSRGNRDHIVTLMGEQRQYRREIDNLEYRLKTLEAQLGALRVRLRPAPPPLPSPYGDPLE